MTLDEALESSSFVTASATSHDGQPVTISAYGDRYVVILADDPRQPDQLPSYHNLSDVEREFGDLDWQPYRG